MSETKIHLQYVGEMKSYEIELHDFILTILK